MCQEGPYDGYPESYILMDGLLWYPVWHYRYQESQFSQKAGLWRRQGYSRQGIVDHRIGICHPYLVLLLCDLCRCCLLRNEPICSGSEEDTGSQYDRHERRLIISVRTGSVFWGFLARPPFLCGSLKTVQMQHKTCASLCFREVISDKSPDLPQIYLLFERREYCPKTV